MSKISKKQFRALISVSNKEGVLSLTKLLSKYNWQIVATQGTHDFLEKNNIKSIPVDSLIENKQCLGHRMKTLEFKILGGLLWDKKNPRHNDDARKYGFIFFDLIIENFYPFSKILASQASYKDLVEYIDVGGPTMVKAALKNCSNVIPIIDSGDYPTLIKKLEASKGNPNTFQLKDRVGFAAKALKYILEYDNAIYHFLDNFYQNK